MSNDPLLDAITVLVSGLRKQFAGLSDPAVATWLRGFFSPSALDLTPPSTMAAPVASLNGLNQPVYNWSAATDNASIAYYVLSINGGADLVVGNVLVYLDTAAPTGSNSAKVLAVDGAGNRSVAYSPSSNTVTVPSGGATADVTAPVIPVGLAATSIASTSAIIGIDPVSDPHPTPGEAWSGAKEVNLTRTPPGSVVHTFSLSAGPDLQFAAVDVGTPVSPGSATHTGADVALVAQGSTGGGTTTSDVLTFDNASYTGDFTATYKVSAFSSTAKYTTCGFMARTSLAVDSPYVYALTCPFSNNGGYCLQSRPSAGASLTNNSSLTPNTASPLWVKLTRVGNVWTMYTSLTGLSWTQLAQITLALPSTLYVGYVLAPGAASLACSVTIQQGNVTDQAAMTWTDPGLSASTAYAYTATTKDLAATPNVSASSATLSITTPSGSSIQYPRVSWDFNGGSQDYSKSQPTLIAWATHLDMVQIGGNWEGNASGYGYNRQSLVSAMKAGDGTSIPSVSQYNIGDHYNTNNTSAPSPSGTPTWAAKITAMASKWFLWVSGGSGTHVMNGYGGAGDWQTNPCHLTGSTDVDGLQMEGAWAKYNQGLYFGGATADAASSLDGPFHDNFGGPYQEVTGDYTQGASGSTAGNNAANNLAYRTGQLDFISWWRANYPSKIVGANCDWAKILSDDTTHRVYQRGVTAIAPLNGQLNWSMNEALWGETYSLSYYAGDDEARKLLQFHEDTVINPEMCIHHHLGVDANGKDIVHTSTNGQALRASITQTLCQGAGAHTFFDPSIRIAGGYYCALRWHDYYTVDPSTGVAVDFATASSATIAAARRWLGTKGARLTAPNLVDLTTGRTVAYLMVFTFAGTGKRRAAVFNPSSRNNVGSPPTTGAIPVTFNLPSLLGGTWKRVTASSGTNIGNNSTIDSGATASGNQTVAVGDGQIFIET